MSIRNCLFLFIAQVVVNLGVAVAIRANALGFIEGVFIANVWLAGISFYAIRRIAMMQSGLDCLSYAVGGGVGAVLGLRLMQVVGF